MANMPVMFNFVQILCMLCSVGMLGLIYVIPFACTTASVFLTVSIVYLLSIALCILCWLSLWGQPHLECFLIRVTIECEAMSDSLIDDIQSLRLSQSVLLSCLISLEMYVCYWCYVTFDIDGVHLQRCLLLPWCFTNMRGCL